MRRKQKSQKIWFVSYSRFMALTFTSKKIKRKMRKKKHKYQAGYKVSAMGNKHRKGAGTKPTALPSLKIMWKSETCRRRNSFELERECVCLKEWPRPRLLSRLVWLQFTSREYLNSGLDPPAPRLRCRLGFFFQWEFVFFFGLPAEADKL